MNIQFLDEYITSVEMLTDIAKTLIEEPTHTLKPVFVDCVDNNKTRLLIDGAVKAVTAAGHPAYSLSSGNELYTGQVVCGSCLPENLRKHALYEDRRVFCTPTVVDMFPEILEGGDKLPTELSCDEQAISHPQSIMTNITAANLLFNFANTLLTAKVDDEQNPGLTYFAVTFDTQNGNFRTFHNKESIIKQYID